MSAPRAERTVWKVFAIAAMSGALAAGPALAADGAALFATDCSACHQAQGEGIAGAFPALAGNVFVQGPPEAVARTVMNGRGGMPSFRADLSDADSAAVLSYVRQAWGNKAAPITPAQVAAVRTPISADDHTAALQVH